MRTTTGIRILLLLALGHTISSLVRTLPAVSTDVIARSFAVSPGEVAAMTGVYHLAFAAGQIPVGVALDRYGIKTVFMALVCTIIAGALLAAGAPTPAVFLLGQAVLGLGCSGMLLCPLTYAAKNLVGANFALLSALVLAVGNSGMLLSASPMALLIDVSGWRAAFLVSAATAAAVALATWFCLPPSRIIPYRSASIVEEFLHVVQIGSSNTLRGVVSLAFVSFAVLIGLRGMWAGPWLMGEKDLSRVEAGNVMLALTLMLIATPILIGLIDRRTRRTGELLVAGHLAAGLCLLALPLGASLPPLYDLLLLVLFGIAISAQPLLFAIGRRSVETAHAGKALAAVNLAFFAGAAAIQALSAPVEWLAGIPGVLSFLGILSISGGIVFQLTTHAQRVK